MMHAVLPTMDLSTTISTEDCGIPSGGIIKKFMRIVDGKCCKKVAIHCCGGLGRTGSLISCYLMKKFRFSASEAVG